MTFRMLSDAEQRQQARALQAHHADWAARQIAAGVDGATPADRPEPSDYAQHVPDLEADGAALDEFFDGLRDILDLPSTGASPAR